MGQLGKSYIKDRVLDRIGKLPAGRVRDLEARAQRTDRVLVNDIRSFRGIMYTPQSTGQPAHLVTPDDRGIIEEWNDGTLFYGRDPDSHHYTLKRKVDCANLAARVCFPECSLPDALTPTTASVVCSGAAGVQVLNTPCTLAPLGFMDEPDPQATISAVTPSGRKAKPAAAAQSTPGCGGCAQKRKARRVSVVNMGGAALAIAGLVGLPGLGIQLPSSMHDLLMLIGAGLIGATIATRSALVAAPEPDGEAGILTDTCCWCCPTTPQVQFNLFTPDGYLKVCKSGGTCVAIPYVGCGDSCSNAGCYPVECAACS